MDRKVVGAVVAAVALAAGGCGSSSRPLTRAEFVKRANAACTRARGAIEGHGKQARGPDAFVNRLKAGLKIEADAFDKLTPPKELQSTFSAYKTDIDRFDDLASRYLAATKSRNRAQMEAVNRAGTDIGTRRTAHIRALGLRACF